MCAAAAAQHSPLSSPNIGNPNAKTPSTLSSKPRRRSKRYTTPSLVNDKEA